MGSSARWWRCRACSFHFRSAPTALVSIECLGSNWIMAFLRQTKELYDKIYYGVQCYGLRLTGTEWLFVLGHMRSGSSLLVHLLNSSPEILGYGETHREYTGRRSLFCLHDDVCREFEKHGEITDPFYRYVMDKIVQARCMA
jgi:hypothetical protein